MKQDGWMIVKVRKCITVCLYDRSREDLEWALGFIKGGQLVPYYTDGTNGYVGLSTGLTKLIF